MPVEFDIELFNKERNKGRIVRQRQYTNDEILKLLAEAISRSIGYITLYPQPAKHNKPPEPWWERGVGLHTGGQVAQDSYMLGHQTGTEPNDNWYFPAVVAEDGVVVEAEMNPEAPYLAYVIGSDTQAEWHQGRWKTIEDAAEFAAQYIKDEGRKTLLRRLEMVWNEDSER